MASVRRYSTRTGEGRWRVEWEENDADRTKRSRTVRRKRDADELAREVERVKALGKSPFTEIVERPRQRAVTLGALVAEWLEWYRAHRSLRDQSADRYLRATARLGWLGDLAVTDVTDVRLVKRMSEVRTAHGASQARMMFLLARRVLRYASEQRDLPVHERALKMRAPAVEVEREYRFLDVAEIDRLVAEVDPGYQPLVRFMAWTGLREGEAFGVTVDRVDLAAGTVFVDRQLQGGRLVAVKTKAGRRTVPLTARAAAAVRDQMRLRQHDDLGLLFQTVTGRPITATNWRARFFTPAAKRAGLAGVVPHDLRRSFGAHLIRSGADPKSVQRVLGHARISVTFDVYGEVFPDQLGGAMRGLDEALGDAGASAPHLPRITPAGEVSE